VINGIAYIEKDDQFIVSGKMWDHIYLVSLNFRDYIKLDGKKKGTAKKDDL